MPHWSARAASSPRRSPIAPRPVRSPRIAIWCTASSDGDALTVAEAARLLDHLDREGALDDAALRRTMTLLHPSIGEMIPVRSSPLPHGDGCRWATFWEGRCGWALVAVCRDAGSQTPIHAHPHRLFGKSVEGAIEELRFAEQHGGLRLVERRTITRGDLVETDGLATPHLVRAIGDVPAIDVQLRGPESGAPGRRFRVLHAIDFTRLNVGDAIKTRVEVDDRPGHAGEGAKAGRLPEGSHTAA